MTEKQQLTPRRIYSDCGSDEVVIEGKPGEVLLLEDTLRNVKILLPHGAYFDTLPFTLPEEQRFVGVQVFVEHVPFSKAYKR